MFLTSPSVLRPSLSLWDSVGASPFCDGSLLDSSIAGVLLALALSLCELGDSGEF